MDMDIEKMFAAAATAAEDTNEGNVGGKETVKESPKEERRSNPAPVKQEPVKKPDTEKQKNEELSKGATKAKEEASASENTGTRNNGKDKDIYVTPHTEKTEREPIVSSKDRGIIKSGVTQDSITKILEMSTVFSKFSATEKEFVARYFGLEVADKDLVAGVVYSALTANERELDAISKLVIARGESPAERAFYLMGLDNNSVEAVAEQVDLLTGDLGNVGRVNSENKIAVCRKIESSISSMTNDVFAYIVKLQAFAHIAIN